MPAQAATRQRRVAAHITQVAGAGHGDVPPRGQSDGLNLPLRAPSRLCHYLLPFTLRLRNLRPDFVVQVRGLVEVADGEPGEPRLAAHPLGDVRAEAQRPQARAAGLGQRR